MKQPGFNGQYDRVFSWLIRGYNFPLLSLWNLPSGMSTSNIWKPKIQENNNHHVNNNGENNPLDIQANSSWGLLFKGFFVSSHTEPQFMAGQPPPNLPFHRNSRRSFWGLFFSIGNLPRFAKTPSIGWMRECLGSDALHHGLGICGFLGYPHRSQRMESWFQESQQRWNISRMRVRVMILKKNPQVYRI